MLHLRNWSHFIGICALLIASPAQAAENAPGSFRSVFPADGAYAKLRYRYEHVDQDGIANNASAKTLRAKLGYKTGLYHGLSAGIEGEFVQQIGAEEFNDTVNGNSAFPVVADPDTEEINHAWLSYNSLPDTKITFGRQPLNFDNQRFIGTVGWRQNDQTFDAVTVNNTSLPDTRLTYSHVWNINRIFGDDHSLGDLDSNVHLLRAAFTRWARLKATGYAYSLDFARAPALSSKTAGLRLHGTNEISDDVRVTYTAEAAHQSDHANNTTDYDAGYLHLQPGIEYAGWSGSAGYKILEGDGNAAFQTPLATLHAHNGWADKFLNTPTRGLRDLYGKIGHTVSMPDTVLLDKMHFTAAYHKYDGDVSGRNYGHEMNFAIKKPLPVSGFAKKASVLLKYADYNAENFATDTEKAWIAVQLHF